MIRQRPPCDVSKKFAARLYGPLRFGDPVQISILSEWRAVLDELAEWESGELREWRVGYEYRVEDEDTVEAHSKEEAERIAEEEFNRGDNFEITYIEEVRRVAPEQIEDKQLVLI